MQRVKGLLFILGVALLVFFVTREVYREEAPAPAVEAEVLLERVRPVLKLTTVEGDLVELFSHSDHSGWALAIPYLTEKRALLRVKARVSVGYDLNGMRVTTDEARRTITLEAPPEPMVLGVEHDVDWYDMEQGLFNSFDPEELTAISAQAKQRILDRVPQSGLFAQAAAQRDQMVTVVRAMVESAGWRLELGPGAAQPQRTID